MQGLRIHRRSGFSCKATTSVVRERALMRSCGPSPHAKVMKSCSRAGNQPYYLVIGPTPHGSSMELVCISRPRRQIRRRDWERWRSSVENDLVRQEVRSMGSLCARLVMFVLPTTKCRSSEMQPWFSYSSWLKAIPSSRPLVSSSLSSY